MAFIKSVLKYHGVYEWIIVRVSGISIIIYIIYLLSFILNPRDFSYEKWHDFFYHDITKICNTITLMFILIHTWIGVRHILEDYIKWTILKRLGIGLTCIVLYIYLLIGVMIIWSI